MSPMKQNESESHSMSEPIAIIGSAYRFPGGCNTPSKLWDLLRQPRDILKEIDPERLNLRRYYHPDGETHGSTDVANKAYTLEEDISRFDASFFGISPLEAASMDPQQRTLLEVVYESTETAGIPLDKLRGSLTSVHVGVMTTDWAQMQRRDPETMPQYTATGIASSIISNRISYIFDLKGASETIDTACSSSLVALHNAARALQSGDCEKAIVAGVNLILDPDPFIYESKLHMLSPDARSRMWDAAANGYARGEGAAAVVLKTLGHALRDGDRIEGVIRSTFVNSDGLSSGLTMPSSAAQTALIRQTYRKAGLDPVRDRPQFFECHGTGTKAGDPVEARAISDAFLPRHRTNGGAATTVDAPLYVGSIKTVVGHLEGCAGLAGLVKVLLSLKHGIIPPNLWFDKLNPEIARYYGPLQIPTKAIPWPKLAPGTPLRASVNSFGFGGTNAHAIIERYDASQSYCSQWRRNMTEEKTIARTQNNESIEIPVPLVLTAKTGRALWRTVDAYAQHLRQHPKLRVTNLSQFMHSRRSTHRVRASFSGASREELVENMAKFVQTHAADAKSPASQNRIGYSPLLIDPKEAPGILGVFTGQGAQWPAMGRDMMHQSPLFRKTIADCESVLQALPAKDVPVWSLSEELKKDASTSRLGEAEISQPLCTAVQLALVNVLLASGVHFDAVVGHSSGEIAATYASGIINLEAAMQIAYYRGLYAKLARGETDAAGGMMAAGLSMNDAVKLCRLPEFEGRIHVAASNAPQSVTLSGDKEAIKAAKAKLDADGVFARELQVDTAYHSHHMLPCAEPYLKALLACDIQVSAPTTTPGRKCMWSSSVRGDAELLRRDRNLDSLKGPYWVANMVQTVLFSRAVQSTIWHGGPFDLAVEVGPHPALKGPTEQTLKAVYGSAPLYTGVLSRGANDAVAFSTAIGNIWSHLGPAFVDMAGYQSIFSGTCEGHGGPAAPLIISDLPLYPWDHDEEYWRESRISRRYRAGKDESHELLGRRTPDDNEREIRWRNLLKVSELPWTQGHRVLGEVLLPGAAYISMAIEAGRRLALDQGREARLLEVSDVDILRPVVVADNKEGTETLFTVRLLDEYASTGKKSDELITASFSFYIYNSPTSTSIVHTCEGRIAVRLGAKLGSEAGANSMPQLPHREPSVSNLQQLDCDKLYSVFETIGLEYSGAFRRIVSSSRCLGHATATASWPTTDLSDCYLVHPATLDVAFQTIFVARAHPDSGQLSSALLPSRIERVRVVPSLAMGSKLQNNENFNAAIDSWALNQTASSLTGNINVYDAESGRALIQVEGFEVRAVGEPDASKDRLLFYETVWGRDISIMGLSDPIRDETSDAMVHNLSEAIERVSLFYVRQLMGELSTADRRQANWYHTRMLTAFDYHLAKVHEETHLHLRPEWLADDWTVIKTIDETYPDAVELQMLHAVGQNVADVIRGKKHLLEVLRVDNLLDRLYTEDKGMHMANLFLANALEEITFKFPRCKILEIGAGTGATTWAALSAIGEAFDTYTYTDLSVGFFENAVERFSVFRHRMIFRALDIEKDPASQSFDLNSYDIIIATNVLHATRNLGVTLGNVRALLKPGGYLLLNEKTGPESLRATFNFGGLEGWWLAEEKERQLSPLMSPDGWDAQLQKAQFSGVDHIVHDVQEDQQDKQQNSMIMSQAVDDTFYARLSPLSEMANLLPMNEPLLIIGGQTTATLKMIKEIQKLLPRQWRHKVRLIASVDHLEAEGLPAHSDVICLQELDRGLFTTAMTSKCLDALKTLFINTRNLLWVTNAQNSSSMTPRASMFRGITRVLDGEVPHIRTQVLGIEPRETPSATARTLLEAFLRLRSDDGRPAGNVDEDGADGSSQQVLWLHEPEAELLSNGTMMVPRVKARKSLNDTYLASTRAISTTVDARCVSVQAVAGPAKMLLRPVEDFAGEHAISNQTSDSKVHIQVESTLHIPEALDGTCLYLVCGWTRTAETSVPVIALSANNASIVAVESKAVAMIDEVDVKPETLLRVFQHMAMQALDSAVKRHGQGQSTALIYGADEELAKLTSERFAVRESKVYFASSRTFAPGDWLKVQPLLSKFALSQMIPADVEVFIDCLGDTESFDACRTLQSCLSTTRTVQHRLDACLLSQMSRCSPDALVDAYSYAKTQSNAEFSWNGYVKTFTAAELAGKLSHSLVHSVYMTNWQKKDSILVTVPPLQTRGLFKSDRTYLMVGAAGGLGTSICRWMVRNGARHVVVTSRNPKADPEMLNEAERYGAAVQVVPMDACSKDSVQTVVDMIRATMPPIAGVCNAAMVLRDKLFLDMNVDHMKDVLGPKMQGTEHLDSIFAQEPLDFFVLLSSSAAILNNTGQSNYHCANLYMDSLVTNRRSRGLAASIIHVGHVCDTGYVARLVDDTKVQMSLGTTRVMSVSETDVHHAFAEAVRGGQPDSRSGSHNIIMGIEPPTKPLDLTKRKPVWISDPRLGHMLPFSTLENQMMTSEQAAAASAVDSLAQQVSEATTDEEAAAAALKGFATKLEGILLLPLGSIGEDSAGRPVTDLGIDSLVAVEIRTWFLKQLRVDVPVMKILGGSTVGQLSALAAKLARQDAKKRAQLEEPSGNQPVALPSPPPKDKAGGLNKNGKSPKLPEIAQVDTVMERMEPLVREASDRGGSSTANLTTSSSVSELDDSLHESTLQSSDNNGESTPSKSSNCNSDSGSDNQAPKEIPSNGFFTQPAATARPNVLREAPMSPAQSRIWFLSKHIAEPDAYNMVFHYRVRGPLSMVRLRHALQTVTNHHECLCMCFYASADNGQPMQGLLASSAFQMTIVPGGEEQDVQRELRKLKTRVWSVESGQTLELVVLGPRSGTAAAAEEEEEEFSLLFGYHHIVMDAISFYIFLADLDKAYRMLPLDKASAGSHLDLAAHQRQQERAGAWEESLEFWRAEFETIPEMLPPLSVALPTLHRGAVGTHRVLRELAHEQGGDAAINKMCKHLRVSPFNLHIAVLQVVIARLASIEDVCVGIVDANRSDSRASRMVGCFVNMLPVRSRILPTATLADVARAASSKALAAFAHGQVPLDSILDKVKAPRPAGSTPLFQVALNYRPAAAIASKQALGGECEMELLADDFKDAENPFEISVLVSEMPGGRIAVEVVCQKSRYTMQATEALLDAYLNVLAGFLSDSAQSVGDCVVHDQSKVEHALDLGRGAQKSFGWPRTLSERVMSICQQHSTKSAIKDGRNELSYAQLASRVNRTASAILGTGCSVGSRIAVLCNPSIDAIVAMLAILHIGGVYVPLDTSLPEARHQSLASNCTPSLIVSHAATRERAHKLSAATSAPGHEPARELTLDDLSPPDETGYMAPLNAEPNAPAILLYTSGSTGTPKGVLLTQANFGNHIALKTDILGLQRGECVLQQSSLGFDMSLVQVFCALANGGCLVIVRQDVRRDPVELTTLMTQHKVSLTIATPSEYLAWLQYGSDALAQATSWKHLCMGGEPIPQLLKDELRRRLERKDLVVTNCYGPTETTAAISFQSVALDSEHGHEQLLGESELAQYAVGKALPNYSIRIRDSAGGAWLPVNHTGEIVIGGAGVALGYLDMPEETRARFLQIPGEEDGIMLYRTGDKGRLLSDGTLLCFGRITGDYQVKLRGLRIELGEVEAALLQASHGLIHTAVVSRRGDVLVAHCARSHESSRETTGGGEQQDAATAILRRVSELLPQYSVPAAISLLPSLPTNANGKLDRKAIAALPLSPQDEAAAATSPSNNNINNNTPSGGGGEKMTVRQGELRLLWERVLPRDAATTTTNSVRITPESDFFLRGGNSLLLMKLQAAIRESMGVRVSTKALYQASTLSGMARCVAEQRSDDDEAEEDIDWAAEVAVPPSMLAQIEKLQHSSASSSSSSSSSSSAGSSSTQRPRKTSGLEILLTGATGFLGGQLLERLVQSPRVSTVHCVAVPVDEQSLLEPFLQQQADGTRRKVRCYIGNLAAPALGLTAADKTALSQTADVIVHAGSMGHCLNTYATLAAPNFASTRHLCSLALSRSPPIPLAFASSNRVALLTGSTAPPPASAAAFPPPPGAQGFTASKWASEAFLEKLAASIMTSKTKSTTTTTTTTVPWRVSIHRPCALISDRAPNSDALNAILRYSTSMRCVPSLPEHRAEGYLDFGQVDKVVEEMVGDILGLADERQQEGPAVVYRHHSGGVKVPIHEFREHMESVYGGRFESVELGQWIVRAVDAGMDPLISAYLETFLEGDASMVFPYMGEQAV